MGDARLLLRYFVVNWRADLQYRVSFVLHTLGTLVATGTEFVGIWALFDRFETLGRWHFAEVALLYGLAHAGLGLAEAFGRSFHRFADQVVSGDFDRLLLRPRSTVLQVLGTHVPGARLGRPLQGLIVLAWAAIALDVAWTPEKALLLLATLVGGGCLFLGVFVLEATLSFWSVAALEVANTLSYGGCEAAQFPLEIYAKPFRRFFTYVVPLVAVNYYPALAILDRADPLGSPAWLHWAAPALGVVFLLVTFRVWHFGVRHYQSTGS